jgi:hypothetical protein
VAAKITTSVTLLRERAPAGDLDSDPRGGRPAPEEYRKFLSSDQVFMWVDGGYAGLQIGMRSQSPDRVYWESGHRKLSFSTIFNGRAAIDRLSMAVLDSPDEGKPPGMRKMSLSIHTTLLPGSISTVDSKS